MAFTALVSDSTAGLSEEFVQEYGIRTIPLYLHVGDKTFRDRVDITPEAYYEQLPHLPTLPTTSQPSVGDFTALYQELIAQGATGIISVHLSSGISGTVNSATLAKEQIQGVPIEVIDTQSASAAHMLAVEAGARALRAGASQAEAVAIIREVLMTQYLVFTVDTLEYLYKGGRIGGASALIGSLLQFKPILGFKEGKIAALERVRTTSRAAARLIELEKEHFGPSEPLHVAVMQATCPERAEALVTLARENLNVVSARINVLTPVIGTHSGPGTLGLSCCPASVYEKTRP
jgi:DegV family protein with EDD domain